MTAGRTEASSARARSKGGERIPWMQTLCDRLEQVIWGLDADRILAAADTLPATGALARLPVWLWTEPLINIGRKATTRTGRRAHMPVRISRPAGSLVLVAEGAARFGTWSAAGLGVQRAGATTVACTPLAQPATDPSDPCTDDLAFPPSGRRQLLHRLRRISADGLKARWDVLLGLEPYAQAAVADAHVYVCAELAGQDGQSRPLLDRIGLRHITDTLLLGDAAGPPTRAGSTAHRIVDRCLTEDAFVRVDPQRLVRTWLRRDAEQAIRVHVGDPRVGPKVRAVARELGTADLSAIIAAYRRRHPADELGPRRAAAALATPLMASPAITRDPADLEGRSGHD